MSLTWLLLLGGCIEYEWSPEREDVDARAVLVVEPESIDFGEAVVGTEATSLLTLSNQGTALLRVQAVHTDGNTAFEVVDDGAPPWDIEIGGERHVAIRWTASDPVDLGWAIIDSTDQAQPSVEVPLTGVSLSPLLDVQPDPLDFGEQRLDTETWALASVRNAGTHALTVESAEVQGPFSVDKTGLPIELEAGDEVWLPVSYTPTTPSDAGWLTVASPTGGTVAVPLTGIAVWPTLVVEPEPVDFGDGPGDCSASLQELTLRNTGDIGLTVHQLDLPTGVVTWRPPPYPIAPGGEFALTVGLTEPRARMNETLVFHSDDPDGPLAVSAISGQFEALLVTGDADFGPHPSSCPLAPRVEVQNAGNACVTLDGVQLPAGVSTTFSFPRLLMPGESIELPLELSTDALVDDIGWVLNDGESGPASFLVRHIGMGADLSFDPPLLDLGMGECGTGTRFVMEAAGDGCLEVTSFDMPAGLALAPWSRPAPFVLMDGETQDVFVVRTDFTSPMPATVTVQTSSGPFELPVDAGNVEPVVTATEVELGPVPNGCRLMEPVEIENEGPGCVTITGLDLPATVATPALFPMVLAEGETRTINLAQEAPVEVSVDADAQLHLAHTTEPLLFHVSNGGPPPSLVVHPSVLDLNAGSYYNSSTECGRKPADITLNAIGRGCVAIEGFNLPTGTEFTSWSRPAPFNLRGGESQTLTVQATWGVTSVDAPGQVLTNVGPQPFHATLNAASAMTLELNPNPVDFGGLSDTCSTTTSLRLTAEGAGCMYVQGIELPDGVVDVSSYWTRFPRYMAAGSSIDVPLEHDGAYAPMDALGTVNTDQGSYLFNLLSWEDGTIESVVDDFVQPVSNKSDILFWIDQSCSMGDDATHLASEIGNFTDELEDLSSDYQLMIVHSSTGCTLGPIWSDGDPNIASQFASHTFHNSWLESGLDTTRKAFEQSGPGGCNEGFLRPDASRVVVLISDEPEQTGEPWESVVGDIQTSGGPATIHAIVGDLPSGCSTAYRGTGYVEAAAATGGEFLSICGSWGDDLDVIAQATSALRESYPLSGVPIAGTLGVEVNGAPASSWTYDPLTNRVVFATSDLPPPGSAIQVSYEAEILTCE